MIRGDKNMMSIRERSLVAFLTFSHPDYTVGPGVSPDRAQWLR
jgi:hypothetical protein